MFSDRMKVAAFTGHRTYRGQAAEALDEVLEELYVNGIRTFLSGMAVGFDLAAAEAVLALRSARPGVRLVCAVPFEGQDRHFDAAQKARYRRVLAEADQVVYVCSAYRRDCYARRNDWLIDHAGVLVAWYDGSAGGTRYTVSRARKAGLRTIHLWRDPQRTLPGF